MSISEANRASVPGRGAGYLAHLDGLRAIAVYLVVAYHAQARPAAGGFIGVDVFFVLSGFLITGMLVDEWERQRRLDLKRFYARRVRRLLPAAAIASIGAAVLFAYTEAPLRRESVVADGRAGSWFSANWHFLHQARDYFAANVDGSPFLHLWSLAVEEQFYLVWPLLLWALLAATGRLARPRLALGLLIGVLAAASVIEAFVLADGDVLRAYYGTDTRAFQLLLGALVAVAVRSWSGVGRRGIGRVGDVVVIAGVGAIAVLASQRVSLAPIGRGALAAAATAVTILALQGTSAPWTRRVLGVKPLAQLGSLSYATYLWHWPLILAIRRLMSLDGTEVAVLTAVLGTALAALSAELLEWPIRRAARLDRIPRATIAGGLALSLVMGGVIVPGILRSDITLLSAGETSGAPPITLPPPVATRTPVPAGLDFGILRNEALSAAPCGSVLPDPDELVAVCTLVRGTGPRVLLFGDSHAGHLSGVLRQLAVDHGWSLAVVAGETCPWQFGLGYRGASNHADCAARQAWIESSVLEVLRPDVVIAASRSYHPMYNYESDEPTTRALDSDAAFDTLTRRSVTRLLEVASHVVVVAPLANAPVDIPTCLSAATYLEQCAFVADTPYRQEVVYRRLAAEDPRVSVLDLSRVLCPDFPVCAPVVDGMITRRDDNHPGAGFLIAQRDKIFALLVALGAVPAS